MIHDLVREVVRNIKGNLGTPMETKPKHRVSSAAKDTMGEEDKCRTVGLMTFGGNFIVDIRR